MVEDQEQQKITKRGTLKTQTQGDDGRYQNLGKKNTKGCAGHIQMWKELAKSRSGCWDKEGKSARDGH